MADQSSISAFPLGRKSRPRRRIAVIASLTASLTNFRLELLRAMVNQGHDVLAIAPDDAPQTVAALEPIKAIKVGLRRIPMSRTGTNPIADLRTLFALWREFRAFRPDIVVPYTMKPIIYGGLAARLAGVPQRFPLVTGLGSVFIGQNPDFRAVALRRLSIELYRAALRGADRVFVYNDADAAELRNHGIVQAATIMKVPGSGVDLTRYASSIPPDGPPVFLMIARLIRDKGIFEYAAAARRLRARYPDISCQLLGPFDKNPTAISRSQVEAWQAEGVLEYLGETQDVRPYLADCSVFVLPSYREGISRSILEAMSTGRAVVTSDAPGCADVIEHDVTGLVTPVGDVDALAEAMEAFVIEPEKIRRMGVRARQHAQEHFDVHAVNRLLLNAMGLYRD